jgi:hypothetical protein
MPKAIVGARPDEPETQTHAANEAAYEKLDTLCSEYILAGPGGYPTKSSKEEDLSAIKVII